jgi:hypothetical protein
MRERIDNLCYCKPGFTGHIHAARITPEEWAEGVLAIAELGRGSMATTTPKLSPKNRRAAEAIVSKSPRRMRS